MPELPEVETTIRDLKILKNIKIIRINVYTKKLRYSVPNSLNKLIKDNKIVKIHRIAKYIIIDFSNNFSLIIHLGMSGRLKIVKSVFKKEKHDHLKIEFEKNFFLIFNDPRKFGFLDISKSSKISSLKYISILGLDALSKKLDANYIYTKIHKSAVPIKQILLNQHIVSGIGNIYANEILFDAKISPFVRGNEIKISQIMRLLKSIKKILNKAIIFRGSSIKNFRSTNGTIGNFQSNFKVYDKEGSRISKFKIKKTSQYGRATYYCPELQRDVKNIEDNLN